LGVEQFDCGNLSNHVVTTLGLVAQYGISWKLKIFKKIYKQPLRFFVDLIKNREMTAFIEKRMFSKFKIIISFSVDFIIVAQALLAIVSIYLIEHVA